MNISDEVGSQLDKRKLQILVDRGELDMGNLADAGIVSESRCCGADLYGEEIGNDVLVRCSKCKGPLSPNSKEIKGDS